MLAAVAILLLGARRFAFSFGFGQDDAQWTIPFAAVGLMHVPLAAALVFRRRWSGPASLGVAGLTLVASVWMLCRLEAASVRYDIAVSQSAVAWTAVLALVAAVLALVLPKCMSWRHACAVGFAAAAVKGALWFSLVPFQSVVVAVLTLLGAVTVFASAVAVARGRTWGLLAALVGALTIAVATRLAPASMPLAATHSWLPNGTAVNPGLAGFQTALLAAVAPMLYLLAMARFLLRR